MNGEERAFLGNNRQSLSPSVVRSGPTWIEA
jgi:hypothetical protein